MKQRRGIRPRKVIIRAGIFLLLGAIVNVAVAWGLAFVPVSINFDPPVEGTALEWDGIMWTYSITEGAGWLQIGSFRSDGMASGIDASEVFDQIPQTCCGAPPSNIPAFTGLHARLSENERGLRGIEQRIADARGWPMRALWSHWRLPLVRPQTQSGWAHCIDGGLVAPVSTWSDPSWPKILPLHPIWPGFAINTLFYAAILWLLLALPGALRRRRRLKRGLCPACAYPVGASDFCTECGKPIHLSLRERVRVRASSS